MEERADVRPRGSVAAAMPQEPPVEDVPHVVDERGERVSCDAETLRQKFSDAADRMTYQ